MQTTKRFWLATFFALLFVVRVHSQTTTIQGLTVIVDFKDYQIEATNSQVSSLLNQTSGFNLWGNTTSVREYFRVQSNNKVDMISQVIRVTLPENSDHYVSSSSNANLVPAVIHAINSSNQTFTGLSLLPNQNMVWNFSMLFRSQHGGAVAWYANNNHKIKNNGNDVEVNHVMMVPLRSNNPINANTICHENGHNVFKWTDYYHTAASNVGAYCLMGSGGSNAAPMPINPALRLKAGWINNVVEVSGTTTTTYTLAANSYTTVHKYTNPYNPKEYLLFHAVKHDRYYQPVLEYPVPEGLAIYYVDEDNGFDVSGDANYRIKLVQADNKDQMHDEDAAHINLRGDLSDLYGNGNNSFPNGHPWRWKDGGDFGISLTNITRSGNNVSFTVQERPNTVLATSDNNGTIHPKGVISLENDATPSFLFTPNPGYEINTVKVNGVLIQSPGYRHRIMNLSGTQTIDVTYKRKTTPNTLPSPWNQIDIGGSSPSGFSNYANGKFYMEGNGGDIWGNHDKFHFVYQVINGDGSIEGLLEDMNRPASWSKAGFMVRASLQTNAAHGMIIYTPGNHTRIEYRTNNGDGSNDGPMELNNLHRYNLYKWYRLVRKGNTLSFQLSKDRKTWFQLGEQNISLPQQVYIGMAIAPNANHSNPIRAVFSNVKVSNNQSSICFAGTKLAGSVIGTTGSYNNSGDTRDKVFDGNVNTFFDAAIANQAWAGLDLGAIQKIHGIRFFPRKGQAHRMPGGKFQASNSADFSSGVVDLAVIEKTPVEGWICLPSAHTGSYRYVRYLAPNGSHGNVAEVEFYGTSVPSCSPPESLLTGTIVGTAGSFNNSGNTRDKVFDGDINTFFDAPSSQAFIGLALNEPHQITGVRFIPRSGLSSRMTGGYFQASNNADFSGAVTLAVITSEPSAGWTCTSFNNLNGYTYVRYLSPNGGYGNVAEMEFYGVPHSPCSLTGQTLLAVTSNIGTSGSRNNSGNTRDKAFDGNVNTFFEGPDDQSWTGLVLSNNHAIRPVQRIRFYPRSGYEHLMAGGKFQGSNSADFSTDTKDLAVISSVPMAGWNCITISNSSAFKYLRYVGPINSYGAIAEIQFYGSYFFDAPSVRITNIAPYSNLSPSSPHTVQISGQAGNLTTVSGVELYLNTTLLGTAPNTNGSSTPPGGFAISTGNLPKGNHNLTAVIRTPHGPTAAYTIPISVSELFGPTCLNSGISQTYQLAGNAYSGSQGIYWYISPGLTLINTSNNYTKNVIAASTFEGGTICAVAVSNNGQTQNSNCRYITRCSSARVGDLEPIEELLEVSAPGISYENPFSVYTTIHFEETDEEADIQVFNTAGALVEMTTATGFFRFGENVGPGLYLVQINFKNSSQTLKLIKQ